MVLVRNALLRICLVRNALLRIIFGAQRLTWKNCGAQSPRRAEALRTKNFGAQRLTLVRNARPPSIFATRLFETFICVTNNDYSMKKVYFKMLHEIF